MSTKIIIDSASDISATEAAALGITMVPMVISFGGRDYFDGVDLLPEQFYEKLIESDALPKTGQVTPTSGRARPTACPLICSAAPSELTSAPAPLASPSLQNNSHSLTFFKFPHPTLDNHAAL